MPKRSTVRAPGDQRLIQFRSSPGRGATVKRHPLLETAVSLAYSAAPMIPAYCTEQVREYRAKQHPIRGLPLNRFRYRLPARWFLPVRQLPQAEIQQPQLRSHRRVMPLRPPRRAAYWPQGAAGRSRGSKQPMVSSSRRRASCPPPSSGVAPLEGVGCCERQHGSPGRGESRGGGRLPPVGWGRTVGRAGQIHAARR